MVSWKRKQAKEQLNIKEKNGVVWLSFPALEESGLVSHSFTTRTGGVSEGIFSSMNFSFSRGDDPEHVMENYRRMAEILDTAPENMVLSYQTHTTHVRRVTEADKGKGIVCPRDYQDVDGLITNIPGITLVTFYADCVPLYLLDPVHRAIGLSHSGWRGTVNRMGQKTLDAMRENYGTSPEEVIACIGPSICRDCFEVGGEVVEEFRKEEARLLPENLDYAAIPGLRLEARQKLAQIRPRNLGQASRGAGVSPADVAVLMVYLGK